MSLITKTTSLASSLTGAGMYFSDKTGRRKLMLFTLPLSVLSLFALGFVFLGFQNSSPISTPISGVGGCGNYNHCLSCVLDDACGFCWQGKGPQGNVCLPGDSTQPRSPESSHCSSTSAWWFSGCKTENGWLAVSTTCKLRSVCVRGGCVL